MTITHGFIGDDPYISTVTGRRFFLNNPVFDLEEMAHSTAMICRFGGHCNRFYSVAEHQVLVACICADMGLADPREGMLHDGHEGYLVDLPKPWKAAILDYNTIEHRLETALRVQFNLPPTITAGCKRADIIALAIEARQLLTSKGEDFAWPDGLLEQADLYAHVELLCLDPPQAKAEWLYRCDQFEVWS